MTRVEARRGLRLFTLLLALATAACVTDADRIDAINAVNGAFRVEYEKNLPAQGTRTFKMRLDDAFVAMRVVFAGMGMRTENQDSSLGYLSISGPAPSPLSLEEWNQVAEADLPLLRRIVQPYVGLAANFISFEPQGLDVVITARFIETAAGTEISLTVRLRETAPPRSGWPRREYLSPGAVRAGLDKIWNAFERELRAGPQRF